MKEYPKKSKKSCNRSKRARQNWFKKGHNGNVSRQFVSETSNASSADAETQDFHGLDSQVKTVTRLEKSVAADVLNAASCTTPGILPYKLRPAQDSNQTANKREEGINKAQDSNENIIVNIKKLKSVFELVSKHVCEKPNIMMSVADRKGLCISLEVKCQNCDFATGHIPLFDSIKTKQGQESGTINNTVLMPVMTSKLGITDIQLVLSCLNIRAPNKRGMQRKLNNVSDQVQSLNKEQMVRNQRYIKKVQYLAQSSGGTDIEYDVSYTSRPKAGETTATQCFAPVIEKTTVKHLPVDIQIANKLCSLRNCSHNNKKCRKNYATDTSINQAETTLLKESIKSIFDKKNLSVQTITTDGSFQLAKAVRDINAKTSAKILHYKCFVHNMRNLHKHLKAVKLKSATRKDKTVYTQQVATSLRSRIRAELKNIKLACRNMDQYVHQAQKCMTNIIRCSTNDHSMCRSASMICTAHLKKVHIHKHMRYLPEQKYMQLSLSEKDSLQK
ncbi:uncharacterized protein LOC128553299, partial [Mercenaria mercenaria]|uniref:uncharacterized protein LOC128553299 n=1 Tax=Mercenaria mercenaria TaxID=6596 RepID=UPI00234F74BF